MLFYSYSYKCYVVETWFAGLTMIKPNIVNNWFNHCEHNGWSLKPGLVVKIVRGVKHVLKRLALRNTYIYHPSYLKKEKY